MVYVIIDLNENSDSESFMHVLINPLTDVDGNLIEYNEENEYEIPLFNMLNENYFNPYSILEGMFGDDYKSIIFDYLNFDY